MCCRIHSSTPPRPALSAAAANTPKPRHEPVTCPLHRVSLNTHDGNPRLMELVSEIDAPPGHGRRTSPKISSTTSRHCLPGRKGLNGSTSSLIPCQKIRSASVRKGTSDSGENDGAQEMSAAARSGTIASIRWSISSLVACKPPVAALNTSTLPVASRLASCQLD